MLHDVLISAAITALAIAAFVALAPGMWRVVVGDEGPVGLRFTGGGDLPAHLPAPEPPHCTCCELRLPEPGGDARLYRRVHEQAQADRQRIAELERELAEARSALPAAEERARLCLRAKDEWMERALEAEREQRAQPEVGGVHRARWEDLAHALREAEHDLRCEAERADALQQRLDELDAAYQRACDSLREETERRCDAEARVAALRVHLRKAREFEGMVHHEECLEPWKCRPGCCTFELDRLRRRVEIAERAPLVG